MSDGAARVVVVDVLTEVVDVAGAGIDREEIAGHLDQRTIAGLPLLHHARDDPVDELGLVEDGDHELLVPASRCSS